VRSISDTWKAFDLNSADSGNRCHNVGSEMELTGKRPHLLEAKRHGYGVHVDSWVADVPRRPDNFSVAIHG
jgi:hypothetical protein